MSAHTSSPLFLFLTGAGVCLGLGALAVLLRMPMIFPSLGASTFILFYAPMMPTAAPRSTVLGHLVALLCGYASLAIFGLLGVPLVSSSDLEPARILAVGLALGLTCGIKGALNIVHPPAGATTMIVTLGLLPHLWQLPMALASVLLLVAGAYAVHRARGLPYPMWAPRKAAVAPEPLEKRG